MLISHLLMVLTDKFERNYLNASILHVEFQNERIMSELLIEKPLIIFNRWIFLDNFRKRFYVKSLKPNTLKTQKLTIEVIMMNGTFMLYFMFSMNPSMGRKHHWRSVSSGQKLKFRKQIEWRESKLPLLCRKCDERMYFAFSAIYLVQIEIIENFINYSKSGLICLFFSLFYNEIEFT